MTISLSLKRVSVSFKIEFVTHVRDFEFNDHRRRAAANSIILDIQTFYCGTNDSRVLGGSLNISLFGVISRVVINPMK